MRSPEQQRRGSDLRSRWRQTLGTAPEVYLSLDDDSVVVDANRAAGRHPHRRGGRIIAEVESRIEAEIAPFADAVERLDEITGIGRTAAHVIIAEVGLDMTRFPTAGHLTSWARFAPRVNESAGRRKGTGSTGHGNPCDP